MKNASIYPVGLCLEHKTVLLVGAGQVALRKLKRLLGHPCHIAIITTNVTEGVAEFMRPFTAKPGTDTHSINYDIPSEFAAKSLCIEKKWYSFELLEYHQPHLVLACTNDLETNRLIVQHAQRLGIWVNNATHRHTPADMVIGAQEDLDGMTLALYSENQTPVLTKWVKNKIQHALPHYLGKLSQALGLLRTPLQEFLIEQPAREAFLRQLLETPQWHELAQLPTTSAEDLCNWALEKAPIRVFCNDASIVRKPHTLMTQFTNNPAQQETSVQNNQAVHLKRIAKVVSAQGLKGELRIKPYNAQPEWLSSLKEVYLFHPDQPANRKKYQILQLSDMGKMLMLRLEGVDTRQDADKMLGYYLAIPEADLPELTQGEYYADQLRGLSVFSTETQRRLGFVKEILSAAAGDFIDIHQDKGQSVVVPFEPHFIDRIDTENKRLYLKGLDSLFN